MSHNYLKLRLYILLIANLACTFGASSAISTTAARNIQATQTTQAQITQTREARETSVAATGTKAFSQTATPARATEAAAAKATRQADATQIAVKATQAAQPMAEVAAELVEDGYLTSSEGAFFALPNFVQSWAQLGWYKWWTTNYAPADFVIRADVAWRSASTTADWWTSGCGFVYRIKDNNDHYLSYLGLDGRAYFSVLRKGLLYNSSSARYGKLDTPDGKAQLMLVVQGSHFDFFVNDTHVYGKVDKSFADGRLALTLLSGTNKGFGTNCAMRNVELWELD
jgi:hypothetical protein